jgi:hypothetical protein
VSGNINPLLAEGNRLRLHARIWRIKTVLSVGGDVGEAATGFANRGA